MKKMKKSLRLKDTKGIEWNKYKEHDKYDKIDDWTKRGEKGDQKAIQQIDKLLKQEVAPTQGIWIRTRPPFVPTHNNTNSKGKYYGNT